MANKFLDFFLLLLTQFAGGPGPPENNLVRFGLPAALWGALLFVAWVRRRREEVPREKLLVWGFGLGLARELFMFSHVTGHLIEGGTQEPTGYFSPEPLEHTLTMAALVVVAGAFIQYILDDDRLARRYLRGGLAATGVCYIGISWWWFQLTTANPEIKFNQSGAGFFFHTIISLSILIAIALITRRRGWLRNTVSLALAFFFMGEFLKVCNFATFRTYTKILCPISNSFHIAAIPLLGYVYLREQSIRKGQAEGELEAYREHLEELVEERTTELTQANAQLQQEIVERERAEAEIARRNSELAAQNAIAATTNQSLDLNTLLNTALDTVMTVLEMDVGSIFLLEPDGETMMLHAHQGGTTMETAIESVDQSRMNRCISFQTMADMQPMLLDMSDASSRRPPPFILEEDLKTMASTPLVSGGKTVGALNLGARRPHAVSSQEMELLTAIGRQIGIAVENAHLYRETERWAEELALLHEVSVFLTSTLDPATIYSQIAEQSAKLLGCPAASVFRWDEERREAVVISSYGTANQSTDGLNMLLSESGILLDLVTNRSPIAIEDAQADPLVASLWRKKLNVKALLCLPVWGKGKPLGFLCTLEPDEPRRWKANEIQLVDSFVNRAAVALENANLHKQLEWAATLEERQRIAADMHDGLAQTMSYMGHKVDQVTELAGAGRIQDLLNECQGIRDTLDRATNEVRQSIASLQETPLPKRPLQDWLAEIADEFTKRSDAKAAAALVTKLSAPLFLPPSHIEQVLNVVQEAITNAGRHAGARQIVITLERKTDQAVIAVEDDGEGFDPESPPTDGRDHFGLSIMRARAARIDGQLAVSSSPGQGTRVILTWPLELS